MRGQRRCCTGLRDCHGGLESAKRLCDVATKQNVRLLCGVGLNAYGGVYYEGNSPYSLERYPLATNAIRSVAPDAWIVCETYSCPQPYAGPDKAPTFGDAKPVWADAELAKFPRRSLRPVGM